MPFVQAKGARLWVEEAGAGTPVLFVHELASDMRQWRGQIGPLSQRFRCIACNARGYPPSDVPAADADYGWQAAVGDIGTVLGGLGLAQAWLVGWSMGAYAALQFARLHPDRALGVIAAGVGSGSPAAERDGFRAQMEEMAQAWLDDPERAAEMMAATPGRQALRRRSPEAFAAWLGDLKTHDPRGTALTCRNYQGRRPSLEDFEDGFRRLDRPVLLMLGEEDEPCVQATRWLARTLPRAELMVLKGGGHAPNLEDPAGFNAAVQAFIGRGPGTGSGSG